MRLNSGYLRDIADAMDKIEDLGFDVREIEVGGHKIKIDKSSNASSTRVVVGITNGEWSGNSR